MRLFSLALMGAGAAFFHTHLKASFPRADAVVATPPAEISLTFSSRPELPLTRITLLRADSTPVRLEKVQPGKDTLTVVARVAGQVPAGHYTVVWRTASRDGHVVRGDFGFGYATAPDSARAPAATTPPAHTHK